MFERKLYVDVVLFLFSIITTVNLQTHNNLTLLNLTVLLRTYLIYPSLTNPCYIPTSYYYGFDRSVTNSFGAPCFIALWQTLTQ